MFVDGLPTPTTRAEAFALLGAAVAESTGVLHTWETDALHALVSNLATQSDATAADRAQHGYVR